MLEKYRLKLKKTAGRCVTTIIKAIQLCIRGAGKRSVGYQEEASF